MTFIRNNFKSYSGKSSTKSKAFSFCLTMFLFFVLKEYRLIPCSGCKSYHTNRREHYDEQGLVKPSTANLRIPAVPYEKFYDKMRLL